MALVTKSFSDIVTFTRASGATWFNSAGVLQGVDFSVTSNTIGTGSKTFTLDATAGVNRYWATGDTVLISDQSNSSNNMTGTVTSYTASTQVLVVNVTSTGGSGTIASWRIGSTMPRFDYNPSTLAAQGLLIEEARTNSIRNNTMQGAVAGTPGTLPTNWAIGGSGLGTLNSQVADISTANGINYIDVRFWGTNSTTDFSVRFEPSGIVTAAQGQTWTNSFWLAIVAGSTNDINTINVNIAEFNAGGTVLNQGNSANLIPGLTATMAQSSLTRTLTEATTASIQPRVIFTFSTTGLTIDITLRIGLPQLELGAFATSVIPTTTAALTRNRDEASVNTLSPWYNATEGTLFAEIFLRQTGDPNSQMMASFNDTTAINRWGFSVLANTNATQALRNTGGAGLITTNTSNTATVGAVNKSALAISTGASLVLNGGTVATNASYAAPTVTRLELGQQLGSNRLNGWLRRLSYYPRRLSDAELQAITA